MGRGLYFDRTYLLALLGLALTLLAQAKVKSTFAKYDRVRSMSGLTGATAARAVLESFGIYDVSIEHVSGSLTDHYDPRTKVLRLSDSTYSSGSVAAICVAAHECGHAIQHKVGYKPLKFRSSLVPIVNFSSYAGYLAIMIGALASWVELIYVGILLECVILLFELVTLPVEFDASRRGLKELNNGFLVKDEVKGARKVLKSAAFTYVASVANTLLQILRLILIFGNRRRK